MMKIILSSAMLLLAIGQTEAAPNTAECHVTHGKKLITFGNTMEYIKFPCKYNAIRNTVCGNWKVTVSPSNMLESERNKLYVIKSMWVGLERISDGLKWEGRTDLKVANKYLEGLTASPFNTKDGALNIDKVVEFSPPTAEGEVYMMEKKGDFKISFGLFNPEGNWHKDSTFSFQCYNKKFVPSAYPDQLCGNGTSMEVKSFKKSMEWRENRQATLFFNIFSNMEIIQTDSECASAQRAMSKRCVQKGKDLRYKAALLCWPLVGKPVHQRCISSNMDSPISAFRHCVEFVCSDYKDKNACLALGDELDLCPTLDEVSAKVKATCNPDLVFA